MTSSSILGPSASYSHSAVSSLGVVFDGFGFFCLFLKFEIQVSTVLKSSFFLTDCIQNAAVRLSTGTIKPEHNPNLVSLQWFPLHLWIFLVAFLKFIKVWPYQIYVIFLTSTLQYEHNQVFLDVPRSKLKPRDDRVTSSYSGLLNICWRQSL